MDNQQESQGQRNAEQSERILDLSYGKRDQMIIHFNQLSVILQCEKPIQTIAKQTISARIDESINSLVHLLPVKPAQFTNDSLVVDNIVSGKLIVGLSRAERSRMVNHLIAIKDALLFGDSITDKTRRSLLTENRRILHQLLDLTCIEESGVIGRSAKDKNGENNGKNVSETNGEINGKPPFKKQRGMW